tara:strand:- start:553 stop:735 length:183 start_codon:yes stop_codon:yes gene_type:complete
MGRVKDWLMTMESLAEEAAYADMDEEQGVQYMIDNMNSPALKGTLLGIFRDVNLKINGPK